MRTIGRRHTRRTPGGEFRTACWECRAPELRSKLTKKSDGNLYHPSCWKGPTREDLLRGNADKARSHRREYPPQDGPVFSDHDEPFAVLGQPTNPMMGWVWFNVDNATVRDGSSNVRLTRPSGTVFQVDLTDGTDFTHVQVFQCAPYGNLEVAGTSIPLLLTGARAGRGVAMVKVLNRFNGGASIGLTRVAVLLYGEGAHNMLTTVGWAWIKGSDGSLLDSGNSDASMGDVAPARTATGIYTADLTGATYRLAVATQQVNGDPTGATGVMVRSGKVSGSQAQVVCQNNAGINADADVIVRFLG